METCPTVKVKDDKAPGGFIVINESDYDPEKHQLVSGQKVASKKAATAEDAAKLSTTPEKK